MHDLDNESKTHNKKTRDNNDEGQNQIGDSTQTTITNENKGKRIDETKPEANNGRTLDLGIKNQSE